MDIVRDVLDKPVVDRNGREIGRADAVIVEIRNAVRPRVIAIGVGPSMLAERVSPTLGHLMAKLERILGIDAGRPFRIPVEDILDTRGRIAVDRAVSETPAWTLEHRLRRLLSALPGMKPGVNPGMKR